VQTRFTVEQCELYGVAGQQQRGIDIYARKNSGKYATYQCKRYQKLSSDELRKLVGLFRSSAWAAKSDAFTLCTSAELNMTQVQDAFEELRTELASTS
jgi:predicted helicase